jgi:hypothetical protein
MGDEHLRLAGVREVDPGVAVAEVEKNGGGNDEQQKTARDTRHDPPDGGFLFIPCRCAHSSPSMIVKFRMQEEDYSVFQVLDWW